MPPAVQQQELPPPLLASQKTQAAAKAVVFWVGLYVVWAHCLVVWKWMTPPPASHPKHQHNYNNNTAQQSVNGTITAAADAHEISEQLQRVLDELEVAIADTQESNVVLQEQVTELGRWTSQVEQIMIVTEHVPPPSSSTETRIPPKLSNVRNLLEISDLSTMQESDGDQYLAQAIQELEQWLVDLPSATANAAVEDDPWYAVASYFSTNEFPPRRPFTRRTSSMMVCSNPISAAPDEDGADDNLYPRRGPTQSDLEQAEAVVQETFLAQQDVMGLPVTFAETVERRRQALLNAAAATVDNTTTTRASSSSSRSPDHRHNEHDDTACLESPRDALPWLQAGLEAVYKKQDIRQALLEALEADGIDTSRIVLDADLRNDKDSPTQPPSGTINLRQILDQPTLHEWSVVVDRFLDWLGGRNDSLDDLLDQWVYAHVSSETDEDRVVGRRLVSFVLRQAGRVEIPAALVRREKR